MFRSSPNGKGSRKQFNDRVKKTHKQNLRNPLRGGIRL